MFGQCLYYYTAKENAFSIDLIKQEVNTLIKNYSKI